MDKKLTVMLADFAKMKQREDKLEAETSALKDNIEALQDKLMLLFDKERMQNITLKGLGMFYIDPRTFPKVEDEPKLHKWLKANKLAALIKEKVNFQTLRGLVNERLKDNLPLPEGVTSYDKRVLVFKKK